MKKILVHLHLFYKDMWPEFKEYINNISQYEYELFVTMVSEDGAVQKDIIALNPSTQIIICENRGYDIRPFVQVLRSVSLSDYSYVVKLHTKRDLKGLALINGCMFRGDAWRKASCFFVESRNMFSKIIKNLEDNSTVGMCASCYITMKMRSLHNTFLHFSHDRDSVAVQKYNEILEKNNLVSMPHFFVAGTIFIARAEVFNLLDCIDLNAFETLRMNSGGGGEYAHAVERFFGYCVAASGMTIDDPSCTKFDMFKRKLQTYVYKNKKNIYLHERNRSGKMRLKIFKIPLPIHLFTKEK